VVEIPAGPALYVEVRGEARAQVPVLLLHGFASNHEVWDPVEPALRETRRTINLDLPGFGGSSRFEGDYSPVALAAHVGRVLDALGTRVVDVVAHSWGSSVALALALAQPERVRRLVLIGAWVFDEQIPPFFRWARAPLIGEALFTLFFRERPEDRFPLAFEDPRIVTMPVFDAIRRYFERPGTTRAALAAVRGQCFLQLEPSYPRVRQPTLLLWGSEDRVSRRRFGERLERVLPLARLEVLRGVGHFPMLETPERTRALLTVFLGEEAKP
jgi:pimeloyl-ACP methyl ester carboxylesterase